MPRYLYADAHAAAGRKTLPAAAGLNSFLIILMGFGAVILTGALLLMLPAAVRGDQPASMADALFTSVSAVCVTGLVVRDTAVYWSDFGQAVILALIQVGGLGLVTYAVAFAGLSGRKITLLRRTTMQEAVSAPQLGGIVSLTGLILTGTLAAEALGALCMLPVFVRGYGPRGAWMAVFHSVSAFCNAGFDILGTRQAQFVSLTAFTGHPVINGAVMGLIVTGGIGFFTWEDLRRNGLRVRRWHLQTKVILISTALLILVPALWFYLTDLEGLSGSERILAALFQSVTARTAGFNTADLTALSGDSRAVLILLMLIGGSPGSTAGGMKTTTFVLLLANMAAVFSHREDARLFGRRLDRETIRTASAIMGMYLFLFLLSAMVISAGEGLPLGDCLFETASAIGTVGLTLGLTPTLGTLSRCILMFLMFFGRVGGLTLFYAALPRADVSCSRLPKEDITVG